MPTFTVGQRVRVSDGKYDGETGTIKSVAAQSCRLTIDGVVTGNVKKTALSLTTTSAPTGPDASVTPPREVQSAVNTVVVLPGHVDGGMDNVEGGDGGEEKLDAAGAIAVMVSLRADTHFIDAPVTVRPTHCRRGEEAEARRGSMK